MINSVYGILLIVTLIKIIIFYSLFTYIRVNVYINITGVVIKPL